MKGSKFIMMIVGMMIYSSASAITVSLTASLPGPQPAGTVVGLQATTDIDPSGVLFRFEASSASDPQWRLLQDFRSNDLFKWADLEEDLHFLRVIANDEKTGEVAVDSLAIFLVSPSVVAAAPVAMPTQNPLVKMFSGQPCPAGESSRARFWNAVEGPPGEVTPFKPCVAGRGINQYVAGMLADTNYVMRQEATSGASVIGGPPIITRTGAPAAFVQDFGIVKPPDASTSVEQGVLMFTNTRTPADGNWIKASDLAGNLIWLYGEFVTDLETALLVRPVPGGTFLILATGVGEVSSQILREIDLAGNVVRETHVGEINRQLEAFGSDTIGAIHHEAIRLDNGHTVLLASVERILVDTQGPGPVNVYGEMVLDLDESFRVQWVWNSFEKLDTSDVAILDETCVTGQGGCPPIFLGEPAKDWLHMNAIGYSPADGHLVLSARHQDAVYKIDYADGTGSGDLIWELGKDGDFTWVADPTEPWPWFSHQHDANYADGQLVVFDNGNVRHETLATEENSRGQVLELDEVNMVATLVHNFDLGQYSAALGSAQKLENGNYHFLSGFQGPFTDQNHASFEMTPGGAPSWIEAGQGWVYRSFRLRNLYEP